MSEEKPQRAAPLKEPLRISEIMRLLPHRYPFLLVDKIIKIEEKTITGIKNVSVNEQFFQGHFPHEKVMPGVLLIEAAAQVAIIKVSRDRNLRSPSVYFLGISHAKFRRQVLPGDVLHIEVTEKRWGKLRMTFSAEIFVDGTKVCDTEFMAMIDEERDTADSL